MAIDSDGNSAELTTENIVQGNWIGTDASGMHITDANGRSLGNTRAGVSIRSGTETHITGNVISGNRGDGVFADNDGGDFIEGNYLGTDRTGLLHLGNQSSGILLNGPQYTVLDGNTIAFNTRAGVVLSPGYPASNNTIRGNTIHDNGGAGVYLFSGTGNAILGNSIFANTGLGISLNGNSNNNQAAPVLTSATASGGQTTITGTLAGTVGQQVHLEFFSNAEPTSGHVLEGQTFLSDADVTIQSGNTFTATITGTVSIAQPYLTATASPIDPSTHKPTDTSEFGSFQPTASLSGPATGVLGQSLSFRLSATDPIPSLQDRGFTYQVYFGEGPVLTFPAVPGNGVGISVSHTYTTVGPRTVLMRVINAVGVVSDIVSRAVSVTTIALETNPDNPTLTDLAVAGTSGNDLIVLGKGSSTGTVHLYVNGAGVGDYAVTGQVLLFGSLGDDTYRVDLDGLATRVSLSDSSGADSLTVTATD